MRWQAVCEHPALQNLPFKIELDEHGKIILTPAKVYYSAFQGRLAALVAKHLSGGDVLTECAIHTSQGTRVADVAWVSQTRCDTIKDETECSIAPEVCIEVLSESNTDAEMREKRSLYFESGAQEVWICDETGAVSFFDPSESLDRSRAVPAFPNRI
jgi:Uma2 family endonuclease